MLADIFKTLTYLESVINYVPANFQIVVQWGSEIWTSLDCEWSKRGWVANGLNFEWDLKSRSPTI